MTSVRHEHRDLTLICTLEDDSMAKQGDEWRALAATALELEHVDTGVRFWIAADQRGTATDLAAREAACCGFLDIEVTDDDDRVRVQVTSPNPEAKAIIARLAGA